MNLPAEALRDLQRCGTALFRYVVASMLVVLLYRLFAIGGPRWLPEGVHPQVLALTRLMSGIYLAVAISGVQAVYLAVLGAAIDKPLWKFKGTKDALQRFFIPWLIINLFIITLVDIQTRFLAADMNDVAVSMEFLVLAVNVAAMPVGAAIMHWGALEWSELGETFRPLGRLFSLTMLPIGAGFLLYLLSSLRALVMVDNLLVTLLFFSATDIPLLLLEAYIFALVWRICMYHRTLPPEDDNPFDF